MIVIDIETVPMVAHFQELHDEWKVLWEKKMSYFITKENNIKIPELWHNKAGIYAEFARVICIGVGYLHIGDNHSQLFWKIYTSESEKDLLISFTKAMTGILKKYPSTMLAGHNINEFDLPFLCRRMLAHKMSIPDYMPKANSKPWETKTFDTMKWWKFGDNKHFTSLDLIAHALNIPTSKHLLDGSQVSEYFYEKKDMNSIAAYCKEDVILTAQIILHFLEKQHLLPEHIKPY